MTIKPTTNKTLLALSLCLMTAPAIAQEQSQADFGWLSLVPPVLTIALALVLRQVIPALFIGVWVGAWIWQGLDAGGLWNSLLMSADKFVLDALADRDHMSILLFTLMIGGMVGIVSRNGGMQGIVDSIVHWTHNRRRGSLATATMGITIFFDDYANTLVVGNTMRALTDRLHISRQKLAYIVDSTAAPVACVALVTTWIGYEVGLIADSADRLGITESPYSIFLNSILYSFYPLLAIGFVYAVAWTGKDFGPMLHAEVEAYKRRGDAPVPEPETPVSTDDLEIDTPIPAVTGKPHRAINAVLPVGVLVVGVVVGLFVTGGGEGKSLREIIGDADSYKALIWASLLSVVTAAGLSRLQGILKTSQIIDAWFVGLRSMLYALIILVLAWALSSVTEELGTAQYLVQTLGDAIPVAVIPTIIFLLSAATAFSTGSSWGAMGILMPLVLPLTWAVMSLAPGGVEAHMFILYSAVSCVLCGSVWGDHCSPISDTTILSSMASGCDHVEHVRTQLPYALSVGSVALICGTLLTGYGFPWWASLIISAGLLWGLLQIAGQRSKYLCEEQARHDG